MVFEDIASTFPYIPKELLNKCNKLWDKTHGKCTPECYYHHDLLHTQARVLSQWWNSHAYENNVSAGTLFNGQFEEEVAFSDVFSDIMQFIILHENKADKIFKKRNGYSFLKKYYADELIFKLLNRLFKLRKRKKITKEKSRYLFQTINQYYFNSKDFNFITQPTVLTYNYEFYQTIIDLFELKLN